MTTKISDHNEGDRAALTVEHREPGHVRFDRQPCFDQLEQADPSDDYVVQGAVRQVVAGYEGAAADPPLDQPFGLQPEQNLTDGAARAVEPLRELPLDRQLVTVRVEPAANGLAQSGCNLPGMTA